MENRRDFIKKMAAAGVLSTIPDMLLSQALPAPKEKSGAL